MEYEILEERAESGIVWPSYVTWPATDHKLGVDTKGQIHILYESPVNGLVHSIYCDCPNQ